MIKCFSCEEDMEEIVSFLQLEVEQGYSDFFLNTSQELCQLFVCTSRDCKDVGIVRCIPSEIKDDG